jgi:hypothetical protein
MRLQDVKVTPDVGSCTGVVRARPHHPSASCGADDDHGDPNDREARPSMMVLRMG